VVLFTVDLEDWQDALHIDPGHHSSMESMWWLLGELKKHNIKAIIYSLEYLTKDALLMNAIKDDGHLLKTHGKYHRWWEIADRRPYQWLGLTGGFWFRLLPLWFIKCQILNHGMFYIHPHDLDENHPKLSNAWLNFKRHLGLKSARNKLLKLMKDISWQEP